MTLSPDDQRRAEYAALHPEKTCMRCHRVFPRSPEHFNRASMRHLDGLINVCRECRMNERRNPKPVLESEDKKFCTGCKTAYSRTKTYFRRSKRYSDGFTPRCKACDAQRIQERAEGKTRVKNTHIGPDGKKACTLCGERKPATREFFTRGRTFRNDLCPACKDCVRKHYGKNVDYNNVPDPGKTKTCSTCKEEKPATEEFFRCVKADRVMISQCKSCEAAVARRRHKAPQENPEKKRACNRCGKVHPRTLEFWYASRQSKDGMRVVCRSCVIEEADRNYQSKKAGSHQPRPLGAAIIATPLEVVIKSRVETPVSQALEDRRMMERAKSAANSSNRRAEKMGDPGRLNPENLIAVYRECEGRCTYCHHRVYGRSNYDHIIPVKKGGPNLISNITLACKTCNTSKNDTLLEDWEGPITFATD